MLTITMTGFLDEPIGDQDDGMLTLLDAVNRAITNGDMNGTKNHVSGLRVVWEFVG